MNNNQQELDIDTKKRIVQEHLSTLMHLDPSLYYASTADIARHIHLMIKENMNRMPVEEQALFRKITIRDVEMLLSFR